MASPAKPKITYLTSGAAGMFCGSCMHDNTLIRALLELGCDATLVPTYTPIRTDEASVAVDQVFFGGINVYLQQKIPIFRWIPGFVDRFLDNPRLIRRATSRSIDMKPELLGRLAVSMLEGTHGNQRKEVGRLIHWLQHKQHPDILLFTNLLIGGAIPEIIKALDIPVLVTLQGDDVFLDSLPDKYKARCIDLMSHIGHQVDGFISHTRFYADYMSDYLGLERHKIHITPLGLDTTDFEKLATPPPTRSLDGPVIGYLARLAPEKGLHLLIDAFVDLQQRYPDLRARLLIAGWLGDEHQAYVDQQMDKLRTAGLSDRCELLGSVERDAKLQMLQRIDLICVPTVFQEPKGLYVLEALAAGLPFVAPDHGAFPELLEDLGGGRLFPANDSRSLADTLASLLQDADARSQLGQAGRQAVLERRNARVMAETTAQLIRQFLPSQQTAD